MIHTPVLLEETIKFLNLRRGSIVLDATVDGGGHAEKITDIILPGGKFIGIDMDSGMISELQKTIGKKYGNDAFLQEGNFRNLDEILKDSGIGKIDAILFDLGLSSAQLENSGRGFSFMREEPLIMTFSAGHSAGDLTAFKILNTWPQKEIERILKDFGEERFWRRIAKAIVEKRKRKPIQTTFDLTDIVKESVPQKRSRIHPATKTFQALRIAVNDELKTLEQGLNKAWQSLAPKGRIVVISFHSLEDRIAKNFFRDRKKEGKGIVLTPKPLVPSESEIARNPRSRSSKLRALEKI